MASSPQFEAAHGAATVPSLVALNDDDSIARSALELKHYRALVERVVDVFGDEVKASRWLSMPSPDFNGHTPLQIAQKSGYSLRMLEPVLIRIEHGVYF